MTLSYEKNREEVITRLSKKEKFNKTESWLNKTRIQAKQLHDIDEQLKNLSTKYDEERYKVPCGISEGIRTGGIHRPTENTAIEISEQQHMERKGLKSQRDSLYIKVLHTEMRIYSYNQGQYLTDKEMKLLTDYYCKVKSIKTLANEHDRTGRTIQDRKRKSIERIAYV